MRRLMLFYFPSLEKSTIHILNKTYNILLVQKYSAYTYSRFPKHSIRFARGQINKHELLPKLTSQSASVEVFVMKKDGNQFLSYFGVF